MADTQATEKQENHTAKPKGIIFTIISASALILVPAASVFAILITVLLQPGFYTGILKDGRLITAFVEAKNWQVEQQISDEIERDVQITKFTKEYEAVKSRYEQAKEAYNLVSRDEELRTLKKQRDDLKDMEWKQVRDSFPDEEKFEKNREDEIRKNTDRIAAIEYYQDRKNDEIKTAKKTMKKALDDYEDAVSAMEDKKKESEKIAEKHKNTFSGRLYSDLKLIEGPLSEILNNKLIDGAVKGEIRKVLRFLTSYDEQVDQRNIFLARAGDQEVLGGRSLRVKFPEIAISLWVEDDSSGTPKRKHILSQILADELDKIESLQNRVILKTLFRLSDTSLGEYFSGRYLGKLGLSIDGGVIRLTGLVLKDEKAEIAADTMQFLSYGQYAAYGAGALLLLFLIYLFFSTVERRRKLAMLKRLFIYPSFIILMACGAILWLSRNLFSYYPDFISDLSMRSYVKHLSFIAAWHFIMPMLAVFGTLIVAGLIIRKILAAKKS